MVGRMQEHLQAENTVKQQISEAERTNRELKDKLAALQ